MRTWLFVSLCTCTAASSGTPDGMGAAGAMGVTGSNGADGVAGPPGPTGPAGSPDTAEAIAAKLATITLNANTLSGVPGPSFALAGLRSVNVPTAGVFLGVGASSDSTAGVRLPGGGSEFSTNFVIPSDYVPGTPIHIALLGLLSVTGQLATPCAVHLSKTFGQAYQRGVVDLAGLTFTGDDATELLAFPNAAPAEKVFALEPNLGRGWLPGDAFSLSIARNDPSGDTCPGAVYLPGISFRYVAR